MHADPFALRELLGPSAALCRRALTGEQGVSLPAFTDHHVHLHLIDGSALPAGGIAAVVDLGGDPVALARSEHDGIPRVSYAGAFLTVPGGYPSGRSWAPPETVREVNDPSTHPGVPGGAATAVDEQASFGASVVKVVLHADTGRTMDAATLAAIVSSARERGLPVVAHVEGTGTARMAVDAAVDVLAHTPFSEELSPRLIGRAINDGQRWISTLDIHRDDAAAAAIARTNLSIFAAAGGTVLYGTDLGNGDLPLGVDVRELEALEAAGIRGGALIQTLTVPWPAADALGGVATFIAGDPPAGSADVARWLGGATVVPIEELIHDDH
ncbi:hypothetical protein [Microbacterium sp. 2FI]|uniref:hypothetical protein n=1 Tax=Microbacterium sp. 2FI TaxID=2502193 RepID=UPI0010F6092D|nr:hypothetical protein [Microbacterium sp. 2FI]